MAPAPTQSAKIEEASKLGKTDPLKAEAIYKEILSQKPGGNEAALREYESALMGLGESYRDTKKTSELAELVRSSTSSLSSFTKAKTAKLGTSASSGCLLNLLTRNSSPATRPLLLYPQHR
jgi:26S proteasome regulatory subunit N6